MSKAQKILEKMTLSEKVGQLNQRLYGWQVYEKKDGKIVLTDLFKKEVSKYGTLGVIYGVFRADPWSGKDDQNGLNKQEAKKVSQMIQDYMKHHTRLQLPVLLSEECPHGHQALDSTTLPTNFSVGCSWDPSLYKETQKIVSEELAEKGAHLALISTLDVLRDPRWGRSEECFSEDPFLTATYTKAAVEGLQADHKVLTILKHLAGQGNVMGGHNSAPVSIGERELREIHLPAAKVGAQSGAGGMMAAYNDIDGVFCHVNGHLLQEILRDEFGFQGAIMADGCALDRVYDVCGDKVEACTEAITAGVDISLWDQVYPHLEEAVLCRKLSEKILDQAVLRVLKMKEELGLFENKPVPPKRAKYEFQDKEKIVTKMAQESLVLLKNDGILPLKKEKLSKLAVIGPHAANAYHQLGDYTPYKNLLECVNLVEGLKEKLKDSVSVVTAPATRIAQPIKGGLFEAVEVAKDADVILLTLGGASTRDFSTKFDKNGAALSTSAEMTSGENIDLSDLDLPACQLELFSEMKKLGKPIIVVLIEGRPHCIQSFDRETNAILFAGYPGQFGGRAISNVLFGDNPNGRLAFSIPESSGQLPVYYNYRDTLFMEKYADQKEPLSYPFGFGMSYTSFHFSIKKICQTDKLEIHYQLVNEGEISGAETIEIFAKKHQGIIPARKKELISFTKVFLNAKERREGIISIPKEHFAYLDDHFKDKIPKSAELIIETSTSKYREFVSF